MKLDLEKFFQDHKLYIMTAMVTAWDIYALGAGISKNDPENLKEFKNQYKDGFKAGAYFTTVREIFARHGNYEMLSTVKARIRQLLEQYHPFPWLSGYETASRLVSELAQQQVGPFQTAPSHN